MALSGTTSLLPSRGRVFRYGAWTVDAETGVLSCGYSLDGREFAVSSIRGAPGESQLEC